MPSFRVQTYFQEGGGEPFTEWLDRLRDRRAQVAIDRRINRMREGNFGDYKSIGDGVFELRLMLGPGYRIYYGFNGAEVVLLLIGGDKSTQAKDISTAKSFMHDWQRRKDAR